LSVRRLTRAQPSTEVRRLVAIEMNIVAKNVQKAGELARNFLKDFLVAPANGIAGPCERGGRIDGPKNCLPGNVSL
jgi:hypothetical protein